MNWVGRVDVFWPRFEMFGERQESSVFARAVVMHLARRFMRADQALAGVFIAGCLWTTAEIIIAEPHLFQPFRNRICVDRRPLVRGAR